MATITKRGGGWFAQIRRKGYEPEYKTLKTKSDAERWAREREAAIDAGAAPVSHRDLRNTTLGDLVRRYMVEITPSKRSAETERLRLAKMVKAPLCSLTLATLSTAPVAAYRDSRAGEVKPGTIARELSLLHNVIEVARREWGYGLSTNVVANVRRLPVRNARDRRLKPGELDRLSAALEKTRNKLVKPAILLAIETALRRGELLNLTWEAVDMKERTAFIPDTKTGYSRTIPLTERALAILGTIPKTGNKVFDLSPMALRLAWNRVRERAGMPDLCIHDLRHEAISRFSELGLNPVELSVISGHRDLRMLMRYTHLKPQVLAKKLANRSWEDEVGA